MRFERSLSARARKPRARIASRDNLEGAPRGKDAKLSGLPTYLPSRLRTKRFAVRFVRFSFLARHFPRANPPSGGANDSSVSASVDSFGLFSVSAVDRAGVRTSNSGASTCLAR